MEQNIFNTVYKVNHAGGSGSCFYLKNYDLFVTNYHVVDGFREVALQGWLGVEHGVVHLLWVAVFEGVFLADV